MKTLSPPSAAPAAGLGIPLAIALAVAALLIAALLLAEHRGRNPPPLVAPVTPFSLDQWQH